MGDNNNIDGLGVDPRQSRRDHDERLSAGDTASSSSAPHDASDAGAAPAEQSRTSAFETDHEMAQSDQVDPSLEASSSSPPPPQVDPDETRPPADPGAPYGRPPFVARPIQSVHLVGAASAVSASLDSRADNMYTDRNATTDVEQGAPGGSKQYPAPAGHSFQPVSRTGPVSSADWYRALPAPIAFVKWSCHLAQGMLSGLCIGTVLFIANAESPSQTSTSARLLAALGSSQGLLAALRFGAFVLGTLSWIGAAWSHLEMLGKSSSGAAPAARTQRDGQPSLSDYRLLASRSLFTLLAYSCVLLTLWGGMASDHKLQMAAAEVAIASLGAPTAAINLVADAQLKRHIEAWITLAVARLIFAVIGWAIASSAGAGGGQAA